VSLSWQSSGSPSGCYTFKSVTLGDSEDIDHFILSKNVLDGDWLLEQTNSKSNLVGKQFLR
jgi:hypothetical protein